MSATFVLTAATVLLTMLWLTGGGQTFAGGRQSAGAAEHSPLEMALAPIEAPAAGDRARADPAAAEGQ